MRREVAQVSGEPGTAARLGRRLRSRAACFAASARSRSSGTDLATAWRVRARIFGVAVALWLLGLSPSVDADGGPLHVDVVGLRRDRGVVRVAVYGSPVGWTTPGRELTSCVARPSHRRARCVVDELPPGTYALAVLYDEDENGAMNRDLFGFPQEGYGFSNDVGPSLGGPPSFASASFVHRATGTSLVVHLRYGL
jgi:uncharacterized protein (DUF2141 family)